jgi:ATP-dependent Lhr-like helicase
MSIGTIVSDQSVWIKQMGKSVLGTIEEYFISKLKEGDAFVFAGRVWSFVRLEGNTAIVKKSESKTAVVPSWMGGRMSLSSEMSHLIRQTVHELGEHFHSGNTNPSNLEMDVLMPLAATQNIRSLLPAPDELLIEKFSSSDGYHLFVYPFEGRMVNEGMAMLFAYRLSQIENTSFSISMNDYGFELLSADEIPIELALELDLLNINNLESDLEECANFSEMCSRRFSEIAVISGLLNRGVPAKQLKSKHLHASAKLFFEVFNEYDPDNLLLKQARNEVFAYQLDYQRIIQAFKRAAAKDVQIVSIQKPTPFCFSLLVDRLREQLSNEKLEDRIAKMLMLAD